MIGAAIQNLCLLYQPALNATFADSLPPEKRGMGFSILNLIMSVSKAPAPVVALFLVANYGSETGMRIAYTTVTIFFVAAAIVRLKLKESIKDTEKLNLNDILHSYPESLKQGIKIWKIVPRSTLFLFFSTLIARVAYAMITGFFLIYAFYEIQIRGTPQPTIYAPGLDPALQYARTQWGYVMIALFLSMIILSFPVGKLLEQSLEEIWIRNELLNYIRNRKALKGSCKTCAYSNLCGGCRYTAYIAHGDWLGPDVSCPFGSKTSKKSSTN